MNRDECLELFLGDAHLIENAVALAGPCAVAYPCSREAVRHHRVGRIVPRRPGADTGCSAILVSAILVLALLVAGAGGLPAQEPPPAEPPPTLTHVEVGGLDRLDPPVRLPRRLPLRPGEPYTIEGLEEMDAVIVAAFAERGHPYISMQADVEVDPETGAASVHLEVTDVGPLVRFGGIQVVSQPPVEEEVIRERVAYEPGDRYQPSRMEETRDRLVALPVIAEALVIPVGLDVGATTLGTIVSVLPVPRPRGPELSGSLSSTRCLQIQAFWHDRYFLDGPRFLSVGAGAENLLAGQLGGGFPCVDVGEDEFADPGYFVSAELRHPWPGRPRTTLAGSLFVRRQSAPQAYVLRTVGARVEARHVFGGDILASLSYIPERTQVRAAGFYFCATFGACTEPEIDRLQAARLMAPLTLAAQWIPRRTRQAVVPRPALPGLPPPPATRVQPTPVDPRWRPWIYVELQGAGSLTASDLSWVRGEAEGAVARFVGERSEIVLRGRVGWAGRGGDVLPPQLRFYSGGPSSVRGMDQNLLGPLMLVTSPDEAVELGCSLEADGCPIGTIAVPDLVSPRPRGANRVVEANVEGRLRLTARLQLAAFVDYGYARSESPFTGVGPSRLGDGVATPGAGVRIGTPVGIVRLDAGYDPRGTRILPLLAPEPDGDGLLFLGDVEWAPYTYDAPGTVRRFLRRIHLGIAVGQPF